MEIVIPSAVEGPRDRSLDSRRGPSTSLRCAQDDSANEGSGLFILVVLGSALNRQRKSSGQVEDFSMHLLQRVGVGSIRERFADEICDL